MATAHGTFILLTFLSLLCPPGTASGQQVPPSRASEIRGVWAHPGTFGPDSIVALATIRSTLDEYVKADINTVMILVKSTAGHVYYRSEIGAADATYRWDFFGTFLREATARGITVHPWFCVFTEGSLTGLVKEHPEWLIRGRKSELLPVVNPALPDVRRYEISLIKELVTRYPVEWVHLDYLRYPCEPTEDYFSFDEETRARFKAYSGLDPATIRSVDSGNILWNEWIHWNAEQVTQFLRELRQTLDETGRHTKLSAAVFPDAGNARTLVGQEWERWARDGSLDMLCPMLYTDSHSFFEKYVRKAVAVASGRCLLAIGIGIATAHNQNTPEEVVNQIRAARALGADGAVLFSSGSLTPNILNALPETGAP